MSMNRRRRFARRQLSASVHTVEVVRLQQIGDLSDKIARGLGPAGIACRVSVLSNFAPVPQQAPSERNAYQRNGKRNTSSGDLEPPARSQAVGRNRD